MNLVVPTSPPTQYPIPRGTEANPKKDTITFRSQTKGGRRVKSGPLLTPSRPLHVGGQEAPANMGKTPPHSHPPPAEAAARAHLASKDGAVARARPSPRQDTSLARNCLLNSAHVLVNCPLVKLSNHPVLEGLLFPAGI